MKNDEMLNSEIREALLKRAEGIQPRTGGFNLIKERLSGNEGSTEIMKRYEKKWYKMRRPVASVCCAALVLTLFCAFNPSVRTWAQEGVTKLIYDVVKGDDGTYQTVQINGKEIKGPEIKVLGDKDLGFKYKTPNTIAENYTATEVISGDASGNSHSLFYRNGDDVLVLAMTNEDWMMGYAETSGDNKKEFKIEGMKVYYYEDPLPEYPMVKDSNGYLINDLTQRPTKIKTVHKFTWEYEGISYNLGDLGENISCDVMEQAVEDIIKYQMGK